MSQESHFQIEKVPGVNPWTHLRFLNNPRHFQFVIRADLTGREPSGILAEAVRKSPATPASASRLAGTNFSANDY